MIITPVVAAFTNRPTMLVCVDDDVNYLKGMSKYFSYIGIAHKMFTDPDKAIKYIQKAAQQHYWLRKCIDTQSETDNKYNLLESKKISLHINRLIEIVYQPDRFNEVSCACFDQQMPKRTGIESIELIARMPIKKAMLSGRLSDDAAIGEFNKQTFDIFISKHTPNALKEITKNVERARQVYFKEGIAQLISNNNKLKKVLVNKSFNEFIDKLVAEKDLCERYLLDDFGSMAMFDKTANGLILSVIHDDEIEAYYQVGLLADHKPDEDTITQIKDRKACPFFYGHDIGKIEPKDWKSYLVPITKIEGSNIYYSIINDMKKYGINADRVVGYADFLSTQDPFEYV